MFDPLPPRDGHDFTPPPPAKPRRPFPVFLIIVMAAGFAAAALSLGLVR